MALLIIQGEEEKRRKIHYEVNTDLPSLGEGGMGQVLRGVKVDEVSGVRSEVAIKFLFEDLPTHAIERAKREASIQIHNENLVEMFGFIEMPASGNTKHYHVVSELLDGVMLFDVLKGNTADRSGKEVDFARELYNMYVNDRFNFAVLLVKNILSGVMALHDKGYIHRDIDPSNIMITRDRKIKLIDFGIAKKLDSINTQDQQLTNSGQFVGKAAYAAPELVLGDVHNQDKTTDLYAIGIMLYQFVVGSLPFQGTMAELIKQQVNEKMPLKAVPYKALRRIIEKATRKKQSERYQSAAEMRVDLEHLNSTDAIPSKTVVVNVSKNNAHTGSTKKKVMMSIVATAVVAVVCVGVAIALSMFSGSTKEELAQARIDSLYKIRSGMLYDSPEQTIVTDPETGAKMKPVGMVIEEVMNDMKDTVKVRKALEKLNDIATNHSDLKNSSEAMALLAALKQPAESEINPQRIKELRAVTAKYISRNAAEAHELADKAVKQNPQSYRALFELATDLVAGEVRTGDASIQDPKRSLELFRSGMKFAEEKNDDVYISLFKTRISQVESIVDGM